MTNKVNIVELEKPEPGATVIFAFPDVGLVGPIAVRQMINDLDLDEIGYVTSDEFPPITAVHKSRPTHPIRIFSKNGLVILASEIPLSSGLINTFSETLAEWVEEIESERVIILGGLPNQERMEIDKPEIHGVPSGEVVETELREHEFHVLEEGFITGINGVLLRLLSEDNIPTMYLMADTHKNYPDPGGAASVLEAVNELVGLNVDVSELREKEEEIKVAARDLMRQTQKTMQQTGKGQEEEMPIMYG